LPALATDGRYHIRVLTRDGGSSAALGLASSPHVTVMEGNPLNEQTLRKAFEGVDAAFVDTNGFAIGEKAELFWGVRIYVWQIFITSGD
jgi:uncharacterized protein YbjT (DUF2867 family)